MALGRIIANKYNSQDLRMHRGNKKIDIYNIITI